MAIHKAIKAIISSLYNFSEGKVMRTTQKTCGQQIIFHFNLLLSKFGANLISFKLTKLLSFKELAVLFLMRTLLYNDLLLIII